MASKKDGEQQQLTLKTIEAKVTSRPLPSANGQAEFDERVAERVAEVDPDSYSGEDAFLIVREQVEDEVRAELRNELVAETLKSLDEWYSDWDVEQVRQAESEIRQKLSEVLVKLEPERMDELVTNAAREDEAALASAPFDKDPKTPNIDRARREIEMLRFSFWALSRTLRELEIVLKLKAEPILQEEIKSRQPEIAEARRAVQEAQQKLDHLLYQQNDAQAELRAAKITKNEIGEYLQLLRGPNRSGQNGQALQMITRRDVPTSDVGPIASPAVGA